MVSYIGKQSFLVNYGNREDHNATASDEKWVELLDIIHNKIHELDEEAIRQDGTKKASKTGMNVSTGDIQEPPTIYDVSIISFGLLPSSTANVLESFQQTLTLGITRKNVSKCTVTMEILFLSESNSYSCDAQSRPPSSALLSSTIDAFQGFEEAADVTDRSKQSTNKRSSLQLQALQAFLRLFQRKLNLERRSQTERKEVGNNLNEFFRVQWLGTNDNVALLDLSWFGIIRRWLQHLLPLRKTNLIFPAMGSVPHRNAVHAHQHRRLSAESLLPLVRTLEIQPSAGVVSSRPAHLLLHSARGNGTSFHSGTLLEGGGLHNTELFKVDSSAGRLYYRYLTAFSSDAVAPDSEGIHEHRQSYQESLSFEDNDNSLQFLQPSLPHPLAINSQSPPSHTHTYDLLALAFLPLTAFPTQFILGGPLSLNPSDYPPTAVSNSPIPSLLSPEQIKLLQRNELAILCRACPRGLFSHPYLQEQLGLTFPSRFNRQIDMYSPHGDETVGSVLEELFATQNRGASVNTTSVTVNPSNVPRSLHNTSIATTNDDAHCPILSQYAVHSVTAHTLENQVTRVCSHPFLLSRWNSYQPLFLLVPGIPDPMECSLNSGFGEYSNAGTPDTSPDRPSSCPLYLYRVCTRENVYWTPDIARYTGKAPFTTPPIHSDDSAVDFLRRLPYLKEYNPISFRSGALHVQHQTPTLPVEAAITQQVFPNAASKASRLDDIDIDHEMQFLHSRTKILKHLVPNNNALSVKPKESVTNVIEENQRRYVASNGMITATESESGDYGDIYSPLPQSMRETSSLDMDGHPLTNSVPGQIRSINNADETEKLPLGSKSNENAKTNHNSKVDGHLVDIDKSANHMRKLPLTPDTDTEEMEYLFHDVQNLIRQTTEAICKYPTQVSQRMTHHTKAHITKEIPDQMLPNNNGLKNAACDKRTAHTQGDVNKTLREVTGDESEIPAAGMSVINRVQSLLQRHDEWFAPERDASESSSHSDGSDGSDDLYTGKETQMSSVLVHRRADKPLNSPARPRLGLKARRKGGGSGIDKDGSPFTSNQETGSKNVSGFYYGEDSRKRRKTNAIDSARLEQLFDFSQDSVA